MNTSSYPRFHRIAAIGLLTACGSNAALPGINPSLVMSSPTANSTVNLSANRQVAINFNTNYKISAPGTCGNQPNCGHVYVLVDNANCNSANVPYNTLASASPTFADLSKCQTALGMHTILLQLRHNDGTQVNNLIGNAVTDQVTITAQ